MSPKAKPKPTAPSTALDIDSIKRLVIEAVFSDDVLLQHLVLKGANAIDLVHKLSSRASVDLDFSMKADFPGGAVALIERVESTLVNTFRATRFVPFDVKIAEQPKALSPDVAAFWGGYDIEFKLIDRTREAELRGNLEAMQKRAIHIGKGAKFDVDVSKHEYTEPKEEHSLNGLKIYVYSPQMLVLEKLRALCQQLPEYSQIVHRTRQVSRAKDFVDIHAVVEGANLQLATDENRLLLRAIFDAKRVPLRFLRELSSTREFHRSSFQAAQQAIKAGKKLESFDFYFDFAIELANSMEPLGDE